MHNLHHLHLATELHDRPDPVVERRWYYVFTFFAGALLGLAVMWLTSVPVPR